MSHPDFKDTLIPWIGKTGKMLSIFLNQKLQDIGLPLTVKQWIVLRILHFSDGRPQNELAIITERNKASLVRLIDNMEKNQLVFRVQDPNDKRVNHIYLSERGREVYDSALPAMKLAYDELQEGISPDEIHQVILILNKILKNICQSQAVD